MGCITTHNIGAPLVSYNREHSGRSRSNVTEADAEQSRVIVTHVYVVFMYMCITIFSLLCPFPQTASPERFTHKQNLIRASCICIHTPALAAELFDVIYAFVIGHQLHSHSHATEYFCPSTDRGSLSNLVATHSET